MDRPYESCEEFYARQELVAAWMAEVEEEDDSSVPYDPDRGGGFI